MKKKHHKYITIRVNPIWNASKDWPPFEGLYHSLFPRKQRGGAGPPSVFRMERLIVSIFSICYKTKFKRNERHVKLILTSNIHNKKINRIECIKTVPHTYTQYTH